MFVFFASIAPSGVCHHHLLAIPLMHPIHAMSTLQLAVLVDFGTRYMDDQENWLHLYNGFLLR